MSTSDTAIPNKPVLCLGEALIDVVIRGQESSEHVGGSPLNVACVLAHLNHEAAIGSWWGKDRHGKMIEEFAHEHNVSIVPGSDSAESTSIAYARLDDEGRASYTFDLTWHIPPLPAPDKIAHLHTGSLAATFEPGGSGVLEAVTRFSQEGTVSYDPNARPGIMESPEKVIDRIEQIVALSDVVKASDEDLSWLYGDSIPVEEVMRRWGKLGPGLIIVTRGPWGSYARLSSERDMMVIDPLTVNVVDTVGAGDSFMGGLLSGLLEADLLGSREAKERLRKSTWADVLPALHRATITSGLTVSHAGAYAPHYAEISDVLRQDPLMKNDSLMR